jgi:hypothetical protein
MAVLEKPPRVKTLAEPDLRLGEGQIGAFTFNWMDCVWGDLEKDKKWVVGLSNSKTVIIAVLSGRIELHDAAKPFGEGSLVEPVDEGGIFATSAATRIVVAMEDSRLLAAPLFDLRPPDQQTEPNDDRGGPIIL